MLEHQSGSIEASVGDLVVDAVEDRLGFDEVIASLPSEEARDRIGGRAGEPDEQ